MSSEEYVLKHDYGYAKEKEQEEINKLLLRNREDLDLYIIDILNNAFVADLKNNIISFDESIKYKIEITSLN